MFSVYHFFIPLLDHILPTTRFMTCTLLHSISETVSSCAKKMLSKFPFDSMANFDQVHFRTGTFSMAKMKASFYRGTLLRNFFA